MKMAMTKVQAAVELMVQARSTRKHTTTSARRVIAACKALGFDKEQQLAMLWELEYCDRDGVPYGNVKKVW